MVTTQRILYGERNFKYVRCHVDLVNADSSESRFTNK